MIQEEKQLLLQDLCTRLPYGLKGTVEIEVSTGDYSIESGHLLFMEKEIDVELLGINKEIGEIEVYPLNANIDLNDYDYIIDDFTPYLRPMSSMTEEEKKEFKSFGWMVNELDDNYPLVHIGQIENVILGLNWLNAHYFDYSGLIEKGLALEAPKGMYKNY